MRDAHGIAFDIVGRGLTRAGRFTGARGGRGSGARGAPVLQRARQDRRRYAVGGRTRPRAGREFDLFIIGRKL